MRRWMTNFTERLYAGEPDLVPSAPGPEFRTRIMCSMLVTERLSIGGHLYLGRVWCFVPHLDNWGSPRTASVLVPGTGTEIEIHVHHPRGIGRWLLPSGNQVVGIESGNTWW